MTTHTQATGLNKPNPGAQGHYPETGAHSGNQRETGMAGDAPAALGQVAQRILGNGSSAGLMDAINTSQGTLGNRNFMQFIEAAQQQTRAHVSNHGDGPLQMMWRNPARQALPALMNKSARNRDRAAPVKPAPVRDLVIRPESKRQAWHKDILFGVNAPATLQLAVKQEAATDSAIPKPMFMLVDRRLPYDFPAGHLWDKGAYGFADRDQLARRDVPYMAYAREAIATALARGGKIFWALGQLHFEKVFSDLFRIQAEYGQDPVRYMAELSFPDIMDRSGKYIDTRTGDEVEKPAVNPSMPMEEDFIAENTFMERMKNGEIKNVTPFRPFITSIEIIGFLMGDERKYLDRTSFFDAHHQEVDKAGFLSAFSGVLEQLQSRQAELGPENDYKLEAPVYRPLDRYSRYPRSPAQATPVSDPGNDPLQMMWPNPGRRVMTPLMSASVFRPGGVSRTRPGAGHNLPLNPRRNVWDKDIVFGAEHPDTQDLAIKLEASTNAAIARQRFRYLNKPVPPGFGDTFLWSKRVFNFADRDKLTRRDLPYMAYAREAIATALARGGKINWALGHLDFDKVFAELFRVETEYDTDPVRYMAEVSFPDLVDKRGKFIDARTGEEVVEPQINLSNPSEDVLEELEKFGERVKNGEIKDVTPFQPRITTTEIIGFLMGDERKYLDETSFFDARHREAERAAFVSAFSGVLEQLRARRPEIGPDNEYRLEAPVYRALDWYTGFPCGQCPAVFRFGWELEEHWKSFPDHGP